MASWLDTVLSKNPVAGYRIDELSLGVMPDHFGNADGEHFSPLGPTLGIESPIETDPSSRAASGRVGFIDASLIPDMDGDHSWLVWCLNTDSAVAKVGIGRSGSWSLSTSNLLGLSANNTAGTRFGISSEDYAKTLSYNGPTGDLPIGWYMLGRIRNGPVGQLIVNGVLVDETNDIPNVSMAPYVFDDDEYTIGEAPFGAQSFFAGDGTDEAWFWNVPLTVADYLEMYESARSRLPMFVDIHMRTYFIPDLTPPPTYAPLAYSHDFTSPVIERLIRATEVIPATDGGEERSGQSDRTRRRYTYDIPVLDAHSRRRMKAFLRANQGKPIVWPITTDEVDLTDPIIAGDNVVIPVDTQYMDCDIGGRVILSTSETNSEAVEIVDMDAESITVKRVENNWPAGTLLQFAKRAVIQQDLQLNTITDDTQEISVAATLLVEDIVETPNRITPYTPTTYRGVERFDPFEFGANDTSEAGEDDSQIVSEIMDTGTGIFRVDTNQDHAKEGISYTFFLDGRELISKFLGWFEARAGRLNNLWVPTMTRDIGELVAIAGDDLTISESNYEADYFNDPARSDLVLVGLDDTVGFRHISSVSQSGDNEILDLDANASPYTLSNTDFICFALMCRLDADEVELTWYTNECLTAKVKFREIPKEVV